jgi:serine/threonine protein kinase
MAGRPVAAHERVPLSTGFRFIHEPLGASDGAEWNQFVGRSSELEDLVSRIVLSNGGAFLLTGYRGVGKTTFVNRVIYEVRQRLPRAEGLVGTARVVDVHFNFARPLKPVELLYHILRGLHRRLVELDILRHLDPALRQDLELACTRTSASVAIGDDTETQSQLGADFTLGVPWVRLPIPLKLQRSWKAVARRDLSYLSYDEKAAEHDLIGIARRLSHGYLEPRPRWRPWPLHPARRRIHLKVVMVFDELDKLDDDRSQPERSPLDRVLGTLKNLFTTSGMAFIFVAGKGLHERWLEDLSRGDSIYESVFAHAQYLSGMWTDAEQLCDALVQSGGTSIATPSYVAFRKYLAFKGRGIPRRTIRGFNEFVRWDQPTPCLQFAQSDVRRFRFYAGLFDALVGAEEELLGRYRGEGSVERLDKRRLGLYYATDWILQREQQEFGLDDLVAASRRMSRLIAPVEDAAPAELQHLLDVLVRREYVEVANDRQSTLVAGVSVGPRPVRYRLPRRRLLELGAFLGVFEQEAEALFKGASPAPSPQSAAGDDGVSVWDNRYQIMSPIGRGGMSTVYLARDLRTGMEVAVKELSPELAGEASIRNRAIREGRVLGSFSHPGIVRVLDVLERDQSVAIVMEHVQGLSLRDVLKHGRVPNSRVAARLMADIADAVAYIHQRGVVWRDPKPGNVIISPDGRVVLIDFGIARQSDSADDREKTSFGLVIGTPGYMSPEQAKGEAIDSRSDVFGMGALFFEILTGRRLFGDGDPMTVIMKIVDPSAARVPSSVTPDAWEFDEIVSQCLLQQKEQRATAADLRASLEARAESRQALGAYVASLQRQGIVREEVGTVLVTFPTIGPLPTPMPAASPAFPAPPVPVTTPVPVLAQGPPVPQPQSAGDDTQFFVSAPRAPQGPRLEFVGTDRVVGLGRYSPSRIGRSADNDVVLNDDAAVSRYAAIIRPAETRVVGADDPDYFIEDLNSANGVLLNGQPLTGPTGIVDGDVISVGSTRLRFWNG